MLGFVGSRERAIDIGTARGRSLVLRAGTELRQARTDRGLSLREVASATSMSISQVSRIERGLSPTVSVSDLARLCSVVGLEVSLKAYPAGQPIRDAAHVGLLGDFRALLHRSIGWATEFPLPIAGDKRAWDALIRGDGWRYGIEAETAPRDAQGLTRRLQLKARDGRVDGVILVLRRTVQTRRFLAAAQGDLRESFPVEGPRAAELLGAGVDPQGSALLVLDRSGLPVRVR